MFSSPFDYDAAAFAIISPTCTLFNKSSSASASALGRAPGQGEGNNKGSVAPLTTYIYSDKERAIKENRGRSGVYRWVNTISGETYVGSAISSGFSFFLFLK